MPKVNLGRDREKERREAAAKKTRNIIQKCMIDQELNQYDLGVLLGVSQPTVSVRLRQGSWSIADLVILAKHLRFTPEDAAAMLGVTK